VAEMEKIEGAMRLNNSATQATKLLSDLCHLAHASDLLAR